MTNPMIPKSKKPQTFEEFHEENPHIYKAFKKIALKAIENGTRKWSPYAICHIIRWNKDIKIKKKGGEDKNWKINNNFIQRYGMLFSEDFPEYADLFSTRARKAAKCRLS